MEIVVFLGGVIFLFSVAWRVYRMDGKKKDIPGRKKTNDNHDC